MADDVFLDATKVRQIDERADFDPHQKVKASQLGEDWGDGFFVQEEPVVVHRHADGSIASLNPLSSLEGMIDNLDDDAEPIDAGTINELKPISLTERQKLVEILSMRLIRWYKSRPPELMAFNPIYDGVPVAPAGSPEHLQPIPGTNLYPASEQEVFDWIKRDVIGPRVQLINKRKKWTGYAQDVAVRISPDPLR